MTVKTPPGFKHAQQQDREQGSGKGEDGIGRPHDKRIQQTAIVSAQHTQNDADDAGDGHHRYTHN